MSPPGRPNESFAPELQHERTVLAWERTAISVMVAGLVLVRLSAVKQLWGFAGAGLVLTASGAGLLVWAGIRYDDLHGPLRRGTTSSTLWRPGSWGSSRSPPPAWRSGWAWRWRSDRRRLS